MTVSAIEKLQGLLRELFQIDSSADLDFGIYRIMNHKRAEVERFIDEGLVRVVDEALAGGTVARQAASAEELARKAAQVRENFGESVISERGELDERFRDTPRGREYLKLQAETGDAPDREQLRATVFNHLYAFFSRYYDRGDFLSRRRYSKRQKYAVPYNGEEVYLHWANADQYYVKTGEHFFDYAYKAGGATVRFETVAADVEHDDVKGDKRYFVPRPKDAAFDEGTRTLTVPFEWRPLRASEAKSYGTSGGVQKKINERAVGDLTARFEKNPTASAALEAEALERHLGRYAGRNTSDFFIHKNLKGFLEGELDFYLKNEVLDVDDLESWGPELSAGWFEVMRTVKKIGREVIAFLAQIEDFQKRLFEKKKLVVSSGYCITLDRVPEELYPEIAACGPQREEWVRLFAIDGIEENITEPGYSEPLTTEFLKANRNLVLDTRFYDDDFVDRLLSGIEDLDENTDGLLINSENFQALNLLRERYREAVKCIYIDPPYNTGNDGFIYKDNYQHSSWMSMMEDRLRAGREVLADDGAMFVSIDDNEQATLRRLMDATLGESNFIASVVWQKVYAPKSSAKYFSDDHDYVLLYAKNAESWRPNLLPRTEKQDRAYRNPDNDLRGPWKPGDLSARNPYSLGVYPITTPSGRTISGPPKGSYWRVSEEKLKELDAEKRIWWGESRDNVPALKRFLSEVKQGIVPQTIWSYEQAGHTQDAKKELVSLSDFADASDVFTTPKPVKLLRRVLQVATGKDSTAMDYFAGSGTTGHAVIDLNREDGGRRKYVLVEMGGYFASVLKPRILKVIYSKDWKDGRPVSRDTGVSHAFKYLTLESYEDSLNNIAFTGAQDGQKAMELYGDDYLLRYALDFETRGSETLLNVEKMSAPFRYRLDVREDGETRSLPVDLPETFAYLLGMRVASRKAYRDGDRRYLVYQGSTREREDVAVIWRDTESWGKEDYERDRAFVEQHAMAEGAQDLFVNGDSLIPGARPLEATFKRLMLPEAASS